MIHHRDLIPPSLLESLDRHGFAVVRKADFTRVTQSSAVSHHALELTHGSASQAVMAVYDESLQRIGLQLKDAKLLERKEWNDLKSATLMQLASFVVYTGVELQVLP